MGIHFFMTQSNPTSPYDLHLYFSFYNFMFDLQSKVFVFNKLIKACTFLIVYFAFFFFKIDMSGYMNSDQLFLTEWVIKRTINLAHILVWFAVYGLFFVVCQWTRN